MTVVVAVTSEVEATSVVVVMVSVMTLEIVVVASIFVVTVATSESVVGANVMKVVDVTIVHGGCVSMQVHATLTMDSASDSSFDQMDAIGFPVLELFVDVVILEVLEVVFAVVLGSLAATGTSWSRFRAARVIVVSTVRIEIVSTTTGSVVVNVVVVSIVES